MISAKRTIVFIVMVSMTLLFLLAPAVLYAFLWNISTGTFHWFAAPVVGLVVGVLLLYTIETVFPSSIPPCPHCGMRPGDTTNVTTIEVRRVKPRDPHND